MSLASSLRPMVDRIRQIPGELGLHEFIVTRVTKTYAAVIGRGAVTGTTSVVLRNGSRNVHCRLAEEDSVNQIFGTGAEWSVGDYIVGPITPGTAYTSASFDVAAGVAARIHYTISGDGIGSESGTFLAVARNFSRPFRWMLLLRRTEAGT